MGTRSGRETGVDGLSRRVAKRVSRRETLAGLLFAGVLMLQHPEIGGATKHKKNKHRRVTLCYKGATVRKVGVKAKQLVKRGATVGECSTADCASGQTLCNGSCIPSTGCCTDADCTSPEFCNASHVCAPPGCGTGGTCRVFVTSTTFVGTTIGGVAGGDAACQAAAEGGGLTGTFRAWLSDSTSTPATRFTSTAAAGPYLLIANAGDGSNPPPTVAQTFADLTSCAISGNCLQNAIGRDVSGTAVSPPAPVWTGTAANGTANTYCNDWAVGGITGTTGFTVLVNAQWTSFSNGVTCATANRLYCFEQVE